MLDCNEHLGQCQAPNQAEAAQSALNRQEIIDLCAAPDTFKKHLYAMTTLTEFARGRMKNGVAKDAIIRAAQLQIGQGERLHVVLVWMEKLETASGCSLRPAAQAQSGARAPWKSSRTRCVEPLRKPSPRLHCPPPPLGSASGKTTPTTSNWRWPAQVTEDAAASATEASVNQQAAGTAAQSVAQAAQTAVTATAVTQTVANLSGLIPPSPLLSLGEQDPRAHRDFPPKSPKSFPP